MKRPSLFVLLVFLILLYPFNTYAHEKTETTQVTVFVKATPDSSYKTKLIIHNPKLLKNLRHRKERPTKLDAPLSDMYLKIGDRVWLIGKKGRFFNLKTGNQLVLPSNASNKLFAYAKQVRKKHYGELVPWSKADEIVPNKSIFTVVDLKSGKTFQVQRRAGSSHADVQPLTSKDTKTMKAIYDGHWSWRRRAILVKTKDRTIAASMHGMPHGAGAITNGFPGHFCIHFLKSKTHRSEKMDPAHKLMVYTAAGKVDRFFEKATPEDIADAFFVALNQNDEGIVKRLLAAPKSEEASKLFDL
ncbi:MAG TPA: hypothetical protein VFK27_03255, partial [Bacillales bacterium]|nr:hypothetical protein [Bacillales bacterium]